MSQWVCRDSLNQWDVKSLHILYLHSVFWVWVWFCLWIERLTTQAHNHHHGLPHLSTHQSPSLLFPSCLKPQVFPPHLCIQRTYAHLSHVHSDTPCALFHFRCMLTSLPFGWRFFQDALLCLRACGNIRSPSCGWWVESWIEIKPCSFHLA